MFDERGRDRRSRSRRDVVSVDEHALDLIELHVRHGALAIVDAVADHQAAVDTFHYRHRKLDDIARGYPVWLLQIK